MFDWTLLLTGTVVSAFVTSVVGGFLKYNFDRKFEKTKVEFERERMKSNYLMQKDVEILKNNISQINVLNQKNIEHFQAINQIIQSKRTEALEAVWAEYLDIRIYLSPIINFFSICLPEEYLRILDELNERDRLNLKAIENREIPKGLDSLPLMLKLEERRPYLGELMYFKFRSSILFLLRIRLMYEDMRKKKEMYIWCNDSLALDHLAVIFSQDAISEGNIPIDLDHPTKLLTIVGLIEFELNKTMEQVISGEVSANISLERAKKLSNVLYMK